MCVTHESMAEAVKILLQSPLPDDTLHVYLHRSYLTAFAHYYRFYTHNVFSHNTKLFNESMRQNVEKIRCAWNSPLDVQLTAHACAATLMFYVTPQELSKIMVYPLSEGQTWNHDMQLAAFSAASVSYNALSAVEDVARRAPLESLVSLQLALGMRLAHVAPTPSMYECCLHGRHIYALKRYLMGEDEIMGEFDRDRLWELMSCSFRVTDVSRFHRMRSQPPLPLAPMEEAYANLYAVPSLSDLTHQNAGADAGLCV